MRRSAALLRIALLLTLPLLAGCAVAQYRVPNLRPADQVVITYGWKGLSPVSPAEGRYSLVRHGGQFSGQAVVSAGHADWRREERHALAVPAEAVDSLLAALTLAPVRPGSYRPRMTHTDDYPSVEVTVTLDGRVVRFFSSSQDEWMRPWAVHADGQEYVSESDAFWKAILRLQPHLRTERMRVVMDLAAAESGCSHVDGVEQRAPAGPRVYAGDADWFVENEPVEFAEHRFVKYGAPRRMVMSKLRPAGHYRGVTVYTDAAEAAPIEVIFVPSTAWCLMQPYQAELPLRGVHG